MAKKKTASKSANDRDRSFFFFALLAFAIIAIVTYLFASKTTAWRANPYLSKVSKIIPATITYQLTPGWNAIALPLGSDLMASKACESITGSIQVAQLTENEWEYYNCSDEEAEDFSIKSHHGYMVQVTEPSEIEFRGELARTGYNVTPGLNFAGVPQTANETVFANELCKLKVDDGLEVLTVNSWENGSWDVHTCESPADNNYKLMTGKAYIINIGLVNTPSTVIPSL